MSTNDFLTSIPTRTLEDMALDRLREAIVEGVLEPGSQINPGQLALDLGVSRGTIRSALSKLEEEGLVNNITHRGSFIMSIDRQTVRDIYDLREVLEAYAVRQAVPNLTSTDLAELRRIFDKMQLAVKVANVNEVISTDLDLHGFYVRRSGNLALQRIWSSLEIRIRWLLSYRYLSVPYFQDMADSHILLVRRTEERNADEAAEITRSHIREARDDILNRWSEA